MDKKYVIDRFEGDYAILIDDSEVAYNIDKRLVSDLIEGDVISIIVDIDEKKKRYEEIESLVNRLFED